MKRVFEALDDSLLGGAAMSIDDLEIVESHEIRWLFSSHEKDNEKTS